MQTDNIQNLQANALCNEKNQSTVFADQKHYSNPELHERLRFLVKSERKITQEILELISLVEQRELHLQMGYSSIFDYLTKFLGYNESSAYRRMQAARLLRECPEIQESIQTGKIHLTQLAKVQTVFKSQQKLQGQPINRETKLDLLKKLENKNTNETLKILAQELNVFDGKHLKLELNQKKSICLTLQLTQEQYDLLITTKNLMSHVQNGKTEDVIESLCRKEIQKRTKPTDKNSTAAMKRRMLQKQSSCQYQDPVSKRCCDSQFQLQVDHIKPVWAGGVDDESNYQVLCGAHNRFKYKQESGTRKVN